MRGSSSIGTSRACPMTARPTAGSIRNGSPPPDKECARHHRQRRHIRVLATLTVSFKIAGARGRKSMAERNGMRLVAAGLVLAALTLGAEAKDKVKVGFIGPLTGGVSVNGIGGRNSADLVVRLRNADAKTKYEYELVVLDDECKPNVAVQVATKLGADR